MLLKRPGLAYIQHTRNCSIPFSIGIISGFAKQATRFFIALKPKRNRDRHHFIVVYKTKKGKIYVSDPAKGLLSYPEEDFKDRWYKEGEEFGMLMVLEPMANFKQIEAHERIERCKSFENLLNYFTPYKKAFGILFAIMLIATGLQAVLPFI